MFNVMPTIGDGFDGSPVVEHAWLALRMFGADLDWPTAAALLPMWRHNARLSDRERAAVLARFGRS